MEGLGMASVVAVVNKFNAWIAMRKSTARILQTMDLLNELSDRDLRDIAEYANELVKLRKSRGRAG